MCAFAGVYLSDDLLTLIQVISFFFHRIVFVLSRWSDIAAQLPGRTANCVKNKWHGSKKIRRAGIMVANGTKKKETA